MDAAERKEIMSRYADHSKRFEEVASRRRSDGGVAEVIPFQGPLRELEQEPTMREIEVLQLISEGLVNREIGHRLFLRGDGQVPRPPPARQASGALARPCRGRRLPPRHHRLAKPALLRHSEAGLRPAC